MAITVQHGKDEITTYPASEKWQIDGDGRLHVLDENGTIASYNAGHWATVQRIDISS